MVRDRRGERRSPDRPAAHAERRTRVEGAECAAHRVLHGTLHRPAVAESDFRLGGVHVDVHGVGGDDDLQQERRAQSRGDRAAVRRVCGAQDPVVAYRAPVHREEGATAGGTDVGGALGETAHVDRAAHVLDVEHAVGGAGAPQRADPVAKRARRGQREHRLAVVRGGEPKVTPRERDGRERVEDGAPLRARAAQEFLPGRRVVEELRDGDGRPAPARDIIHRLDVPAGRANGGACTVGGRGLQRHATHRADGRERLAAKAEAGNADEVGRLRDLRRGVPLEREDRIVSFHAAAVIADANELAAAVLDVDVDGRGTGIDGVLHQLLHRRRGTLDHLAGGDLVGHG